ncbi:MAG: hypothetical protein J0H21_08940, partial [Rhizobiales bacterium]|nr:hypothetical protein [Hyphomicrobiales bacterium]
MENEVNGGMAIHESRHQGSDRTAAILSTIGEVVYRWSQADDRIEWNGDAAALFGLASPESVATGAA